MKIVISFCLLIFYLHAYPHIIITGSGKGSVSQTDMRGLKPGDTLAIRAGHYEKGGKFSNLSGITIINYQGIVDFGSTIYIGNLKKVSITGSGVKDEMYGFRFRNFQGSAFRLEAACRSLSISFCEYRDHDGIAFDASQFFITYTGDSSTFALYKTSLSYQKLVHSGPLFVGSWDANNLFRNVIDSIAFLHIIVDSTTADVCQVLAHSIYRMWADHWRVTGPCPNGKHDAGIFQTAGNGTVSNMYRKDGWGYIWRSWNLALNGRADSYLFNCIDLNTDHYGTIDTRMEPADTTTGNTIPFVRGASMHVLNNTSGNKRAINYVSQIVIAGNYGASSGYRLEVRNNLAFNTIATGLDQLIKQNTGESIPDTSNNLYSKNPIADGILTDTIECKLNPYGPAIDRAITYSFIPTDIDGVTRPTGKSSDIGAREYPEKIPEHEVNQVATPKKWLIPGLGVLGFALILLVFLKTAGKKPKNGMIL
jgi:hypothetical protein